MRTQPINSAEKNNTNIIAAGVGGASVAALATRYLPLTKAEHDEAFKAVAGDIAKQVRALKEEEFQSVLKEVSKNEKYGHLTDVFTKNRDNIIDGVQDQLEQTAKNLDDGSKNIFISVANKIGEFGKNAQKSFDTEVIKQAKKQRPVFYFAALAGAASMTLAVLKNVIVGKKTQEQTVGISYDKEGMIIDAPDSLSLAIVLDEIA